MTVFSVISIIFISIIYFNPYVGILTYIVLRPLVDWAWDVEIVAGVSILSLASLIPVSVVILKTKWWMAPSQFGNYSIPYKLLTVFIFYSIFHLFQDISDGNLVSGFNSIARLLCGFAGAILFLKYINTEEKYRQLLIAVLYMGAIPAIFVILQSIGLMDDARTMSYGDHERLTGFNHGSINIRQYFSFSILALFALLALEANSIKKIQFLMLGSLSFVGMWFLYSKAALMFLLALPVLIFFTLAKRIRASVIIWIAIPCLFFMNDLYQYTESIFYKEISSYDVIQEDPDGEIGALNGRLFAWAAFQKKLEEASTFDLVFGTFEHLKIGFSGSVHNDFLLNLGRYGIIGVAIYFIMVLSLLYLAFFSCDKRKTNALTKSRLFMVRGLVTLWVIDAMGLHPSMYPVFLFLIFGFVAILSKELSYNRSLNTKNFTAVSPLQTG